MLIQKTPDFLRSDVFTGHPGSMVEQLTRNERSYQEVKTSDFFIFLASLGGHRRSNDGRPKEEERSSALHRPVWVASRFAVARCQILPVQEAAKGSHVADGPFYSRIHRSRSVTGHF